MQYTCISHFMPQMPKNEDELPPRLVPYESVDPLIFSRWQNILYLYCNTKRRGKGNIRPDCSITQLQEEQCRESIAPPQL
ncbi:hypothetical protein EUGRSUZ_F02824 [Eucalyptus grandis]|uniref:Uncharacterized protein n=2 Tax=Eucalyptus grandis TaxID=71139 RepID=A0ACC3KJA8_EUCGR|nr:hypothetical protein EUGRSUZ_F02824 [Eucalyptus grandis]